MNDKKVEEKQSFITEARRKQIMDAAIHTLDEIGYVNASLAQIAKRAGISTALISYHFKDRNDLLDNTLMMLLEEAANYVLGITQAAATATDKLHAFIASSIAYQANHPKQYTALLEIIFHARTSDNVPYYKLNDGDVEPEFNELQEILKMGQATGEFRQFHILIMATAIRGAIGEYMINPGITTTIDQETYSEELKAIFDRSILAIP